MTIMVDGTTGQSDASKPEKTNGGIPAAPNGAPPNQSGAPLSSPVPPPAPASQPPTPPQTPIGADMAKILAGVKLPERNETRGLADKKPSVIENVPPAIVEAEAAVEEAAAPIDTNPVQNVHTLKQDLQHVVQEQKVSLVHAVALEQDRESQPEVIIAPKKSNTVKNIVFAAALLLVLGGAALFGVYVVMKEKSAPLPPIENTSLVFAERTVALPIDGLSPTVLKNTIAEARTSSAASLGSVTRIVPMKNVLIEDSVTPVSRPTTLAEFFEAIGAHPPDELTRALTGEFFFGLHTVDKNAPILVMTVSSYDHAFAGMLAWEKTLNADLSPIFTRVPPLTLGQDGLPADRSYTDVVMRNYDVRALKDDSGTIQLYYSFPTRTTLVIAESPYTFAELLSRLQGARKL